SRSRAATSSSNSPDGTPAGRRRPGISPRVPASRGPEDSRRSTVPAVLRVRRRTRAPPGGAMVRRNDLRRAALVDAAIEVLAGEGAGGRTFRAVDGEAGVPTGTASNDFANRDDLLMQAGARVYERLQPDEATIARQRAAGRDRET